MSDSSIPWTATSPQFDQEWQSGSLQEVPDILATMFAKQADHMREYAKITGGPSVRVDPGTGYDLHSPVLHAKAREFAGYTVEELYEAIGLLKNKPWKQSLRETDVEAFKKEIGDAWHFFIELMIIFGFDESDIFRIYFERAVSNDTRRATGY